MINIISCHKTLYFSYRNKRVCFRNKEAIYLFVKLNKNNHDGQTFDDRSNLVPTYEAKVRN